MTERKRWIPEEPTTPQTRRAIGRLVDGALERLESLAPRDATAEALYLSAPFPCAIDRAVQPLTDGLRLLDAEARGELFQTAFTDEQGRALTRFAERMAHFSVRKRDPGLVLDGLLAAAILDGRGGPDALVRLCGKLYQSALELDADPVDLFDRAARLAAPATGQVISGFVRRDSDGRIL
jgi:hypothetical protein